MTHPYPALPLTLRQRYPEHYRPTTWEELHEHGCPRCGAGSFRVLSPCDGIHDLEMVLDFDPELDEDYVNQVVAYWGGHTDMGDGPVICSLCILEINVDQETIEYA